MKKKTLIALLCAFTIMISMLTGCGKTDITADSHPEETKVPQNQVYQNGSNTQKQDDAFTGPYYGKIKKVDSTSIEVELLTIGNESVQGSNSHQSTNGGDTKKFDQQAKKTDKPADIHSNGEILCATFAPAIQISNAGKTVLDLKEGDMIAFYTDASSDKEIVSINIMG